MVLQLSRSAQKSLLSLKNQQRGWAKQAELGGDGQDIPFEQALSNLAHAYLRDKAPSLLEFEVGFQLLERNQENTKAVGVVGFKVGSMWLYVPIFFLRGELKGHELLYIKDQDVFVPLKENWLNYLLSRKPNILGDGTDKNTHELGVMNPSLQQLSKNRVKTSSSFPAWVEDFLPVWAYMATTPVDEQTKFAGARSSFPEMVAAGGGDSVKFMYEVANRYPTVFKAATELYGDKLSGALKQAVSQNAFNHDCVKYAVDHNLLDEWHASGAPRTGSVIDTTIPHPIKTGALEIITMDNAHSTTLSAEADEEDQEKLLRDGVLIKDKRSGDEVSVSYNTQVEKKLFNPAESGLYEVLTNTGDIERCFIALAPMGPNGRFTFATLVRAEGGGKQGWINVHPTRIWAASKIEGDEYNDWLDGLSVPDSLSKGSVYMLCGRTGECTVPFRVEGTIGDAEGKTVYNVDFHTHAERGRAVYEAGHRSIPFSGDGEYSPYRDGQRIHLKGKLGSKLVASQGDVFVPEGFYAIQVSKLEDDFDADRKEPLAPGNIADAEMMIMSKTAELTIYHSGYEVELNNLRMEPKQAFIALIKDHGFREKQARDMLREAEQKRKIRYRVKYAEYVKQAQDPFLQPGPNAPGFPGPMMGTTDVIGGQVPAQFPMSSQQPVTDMYRGDPSQYDPTAVPDPMAMQGAQQAAQLGQKEVFDTAMIGSMLKAVRQDSMVDKYLGDLMKGMDRVGRILFMFYFHQDDFGDRYGKADMPELEDSLRNTFESMGDLVLFLKQKSIDPYPEEGALGVDLGPIAGT